MSTKQCFWGLGISLLLSLSTGCADSSTSNNSKPKAQVFQVSSSLLNELRELNGLERHKFILEFMAQVSTHGKFGSEEAVAKALDQHLRIDCLSQCFIELK